MNWFVVKELTHSSTPTGLAGGVGSFGGKGVRGIGFP